ncbi:hypothetical protein SDC9_40614 [bioreactor metagenome]|uniref:KilA-N DNA-binding domain-containing protein n=1 Tax=bioreactor metagenome TaxID=1076179 RepID=A0A644VTB8_9ZZZZ
MLDRDLAELYQVETKYINRAVKRNPARFPVSFAFRLAAKEISLVQNHQESKIISNSLRFQNGTIENRESIKQDDDENANGRGKHSKYLPWVFTEEGVAMLLCLQPFYEVILPHRREFSSSVHLLKCVHQFLRMTMSCNLSICWNSNKLSNCLKIAKTSNFRHSIVREKRGHGTVGTDAASDKTTTVPCPAQRHFSGLFRLRTAECCGVAHGKVGCSLIYIY